MNDPRFRFDAYGDIEGYDEDGFGQVDGDQSGAVLFQQRSAGQPFLRNPQPPWHMWGNTVQLRVDSTGLDPDRPALVSQQVVKVGYKRPDTWSFFFGAKLTGSTPLPSAATIAVMFDIITGVGRSNYMTGPQPIPADPFDRPAFCKFVWALNMNQVPGGAPGKYTARVPSPRLDDRVPAGDFSARDIDWIAAEQIQVNVQLVVLPILLPTPFIYTAEASAYFAPRSHVRPDWFRDGPEEIQYPGDEVGGS